MWLHRIAVSPYPPLRFLSTTKFKVTRACHNQQTMGIKPKTTNHKPQTTNYKNTNHKPQTAYAITQPQQSPTPSFKLNLPQPVPQHLFPRSFARHTSHVTRHTSHVTRHTSHVTHHKSHVTCLSSFLSHVIIARHACRVFVAAIPEHSAPYIKEDSFHKCE